MAVVKRDARKDAEFFRNGVRQRSGKSGIDSEDEVVLGLRDGGLWVK